MPSWMAALATREPIAPRPTTPSVLRKISGPTKADLPFSTTVETSTPDAACSRTQFSAPGISREPISMAHSTSSFTALALAPGVENTAMPASEQRSMGMLFTPTPARAMASSSDGKSMSRSLAERTMMPSGFVWLSLT